MLLLLVLQIFHVTKIVFYRQLNSLEFLLLFIIKVIFFLESKNMKDKFKCTESNKEINFVFKYYLNNNG
jgi:hypothetical protein